MAIINNIVYCNNTVIITTKCENILELSSNFINQYLLYKIRLNLALSFIFIYYFLFFVFQYL